MQEILEQVNAVVWGIPALLGILGIGLYLSVRTCFAQLRLFPQALRGFWRTLTGKQEMGEGVSPFQALCTALAATVGTGNLAGVAGAIAIGGPGAIFWMWISAILGMMTKFAEATLSVRYRERNSTGEWVGGPMYMIKNGMGKRFGWLASVYCFFGVVAAFGVGNATQVNAVIGGVNQALIAWGGQETHLGNLLMGIFLALLICGILLGGMKKIGTMAEKVVPFASVCYLLLGLGVLVMRWNCLPDAFASITTGAFSPRAVTGGAVGSMFVGLRIGVSRGVFTNEAGMGTAGIAHAAANVKHPAQQGLMGIMEVFLDTIVICTMTALVILVSGVEIPYGEDTGVVLTTQAFSQVYGGWVSIFIAAALCCFAIATVLGWGLYGARCAQFLFGDGVWKKFVFLQGGAVILGAVLKTGTVWLLSETVNGLMAIPNLIALGYLAPELCRLTKEYKRIKDFPLRKECAIIRKKQKKGIKMNKQEVYEFLKSKNIWHEITEHGVVYTMEDLSHVELPYPEADAKNLFVRDDKKRNYYLISVTSEKRVDLKEFRNKYGTAKLSFASADDLMAIMGLIPGAVTPLGLLNDKECRVKLFLDQAFNGGLIGVHPNDNTATVWLKTEDLVMILRESGHEVRFVEV